MPFASENTITVTGTYRLFNGAPASGSVEFLPQPGLTAILDPGGNQIIIPSVVGADLDSNGHFSVVLPASDDPDTAPTGFTYRVTEDIIGRAYVDPRVYNILVPVSSAGGTLDLADAVVADPAPGVVSYVLVGTFNGLADRVSTLEGKELPAVRALTVNASLTNADDLLVFTGAASHTLALHNAVGALQKLYTVKNDGTGTITINPLGGQTISGASSYVLGPGQVVDLLPLNSNWTAF